MNSLKWKIKTNLNLLSKEKGDKSPTPDTANSNFVKRLKFCSINIDGIRGKILELLAFLDAHQLHVVVIQETKIDSIITTSELFPETCMYSVYRKDRNTHGGGVMPLIHRDISHMPVMELENNSESVWVIIFANQSSHYVTSWYRQPNGTVEDFQSF